MLNHQNPSISFIPHSLVGSHRDDAYCQAISGTNGCCKGGTFGDVLKYCKDNHIFPDAIIYTGPNAMWYLRCIQQTIRHLPADHQKYKCGVYKVKWGA